MNNTYDSKYSITIDINLKLGNEPKNFDSTYSICMDIYNKLGGDKTGFDSIYSILESIMQLIDAEHTNKFDSIYSQCLSIYNKLGGEPKLFDSTYSILLGILPLVKLEPEPEPLDKDYFYLQPLSTGNYSVDTNDEVWKQKDTFEFRKDNTNWRKFSSLTAQDTYVGFDVYMANNPDLVALALDINAYNTYVVEQNFRVGISLGGPTTTVATFLGTDEKFAYYSGTPEELEMRDFYWVLADSYELNILESEFSRDRMFEWDGTNFKGTNTNISDYSSFNVFTTIITETIPLTANDKLYLRNTSGSIHSGIINSIQSVNYNIGGILNTLTDYTDETYTITESYAKLMFKGDTYLISAGDFKLPATSLAENCYYGMFDGCSSLTSAPELPATSLAEYCYSFMFMGCTSLTEAPVLPATSLVRSCYAYMFNGCSKINYIKCLGTNAIQVSATENWLNNTSATGTFEGDSSLIADWSYGYNGVPDGWTEIGINRNLFRLECESGSATIGIQKKSSYYTGEYSIDNGVSWTPISTSILISLSQGESVAFRGKLTKNNSGDDYTLFKKTNDNSSKINVKGMLFYFLKKDGYNNYSTGYDYEATLLFSGSSSSNGVNIVDASDLILFKNVLYCSYINMFSGCTSLTSAPELPATNLANSCYEGMFSGCSSLTSAPELPATRLAEYCYSSMFDGCSSLTSAPELPATTLASFCYSSMFSGCSSLTSAPELPATSLTTFCYSSMFSGCSSLTSAPELPATSLTTYCYYYMFDGCSSLTSVTHHISSWSINNTSNWLNGVAATGIVKCPANSTIPSDSVSGIPTGWTRENL